MDILDHQSRQSKSEGGRNRHQGAVVAHFVELQFFGEGGVGAAVGEELFVVDAEEVFGGEGAGLAELLAEHGAEGAATDFPEGVHSNACGVDFTRGSH